MSDNPFAGTEPPAGVDYGSFTFTVKQFVLASLADAASRTVPGKGLQHLSCFQVRVSEAGLRVAATDMERTTFAVTSAVSCALAEPRTVCIPARRLLSILREAPDGDLAVTVKKNLATVSADGPSWVLRLPDPSAYPELPDADAAELTPYSRTGLQGALRAVKHAVCKDAGQPSLTQVAVTGEGDDTVVTASDRSRLARSPLPKFPVRVTIPSVVLEDLLRLLAGHPGDDILVGETDSSIIFRAGAVTLAAGKRTTPYPDMDGQLLAPALKSCTQKLTADKAELARAIARVSINADAQTSAIALRLTAGTVTVESRDKAGNSATESVLASWDGTDRALVLNHGYLTDMIAACPSPSLEFRLGPDMGKKLSPLLLTSGAGSVQVLTRMPAALLGY